MSSDTNPALVGSDVPTDAMLQSFASAHNPQQSCPLFSLLPGEIRNTIFSLALRQYYSSDLYDSDSYWTRPGYRAPLIQDTALLSTCRLVYLETRLLPIQLHGLVLWFYRGPEHDDNTLSYALKCIPQELRPHIDTVHLFTQLYWLEQAFADTLSEASTLMLAKRLQITVRHSDWWYWESNTPLAIEQDWIEGLQNVHSGLEEFVVELETMERDRDQLLAIAQDMRSWHIEIADEKVVVLDAEIAETRWTGTSVFEKTLHYDKKEDAWLYITSASDSDEDEESESSADESDPESDIEREGDGRGDTAEVGEDGGSDEEGEQSVLEESNDNATEGVDTNDTPRAEASTGVAHGAPLVYCVLRLVWRAES